LRAPANRSKKAPTSEGVRRSRGKRKYRRKLFGTTVAHTCDVPLQTRTGVAEPYIFAYSWRCLVGRTIQVDHGGGLKPIRHYPGIVSHRGAGAGCAVQEDAVRSIFSARSAIFRCDLLFLISLAAFIYRDASALVGTFARPADVRHRSDSDSRNLLSDYREADSAFKKPASAASLIESQSPGESFNTKVIGNFSHGSCRQFRICNSRNCEDFICAKSKSFEPGCRNWIRFAVWQSCR
jgi:hypothetical protein